MIRLVVVAIEHHQIATRQQCIGDHFIRGRRAVQNEIGFIGVKDLCGKLLRMFGRTFVNQQIAELHVGIAHICTKDIFAKEVIEVTSGRVLFKECAMLMPRTGERAVLHLHILRQRVVKWRQKVFLIQKSS